MWFTLQCVIRLASWLMHCTCSLPLLGAGMVMVRLLGHGDTFKAVWIMFSCEQEPSWNAVLPVAMKKGMLHEADAPALCHTRIRCTWAVYMAVLHCTAVSQSLFVDFPAKSSITQSVHCLQYVAAVMQESLRPRGQVLPMCCCHVACMTIA